MGGDIALDVLGQRDHVILEEMVGALDDAVVDLDVALMRQLVDQLLLRLEGDDLVLVALQDET